MKPELNEYWIKFIEEHIDEIEANDWTSFYNAAYRNNQNYIGELTDALYSYEINPLEGMTEVPKKFLFNSMTTEHLVLPETIQYVRPYACANSMLESIVIPSGCIKIEQNAFRECPNLASVTILGKDTVSDATAWAFDEKVKFYCNKDNQQIQALAYVFDFPIELI